jgi:hypothetical protein
VDVPNRAYAAADSRGTIPQPTLDPIWEQIDEPLYRIPAGKCGRAWPVGRR